MKEKLSKVMLTGSLVIVMIFTPCLHVHAQYKAESKPSHEKGPIKIGVNLDLTGVMSEVATHVRMGCELYLEEIGFEVAGRKIEIIEYDNRSDPRISLEVTKKLGVCRRTVCESFVLPLSALFGPNNRVFNATIYFL